jgi:steroid delta-isomerase-like uncharacterized protein
MLNHQTRFPCRSILPALVMACCTLIGACASPGGGATNQGATDIMSLYGNFKAAWNRHDAKAIAAMFHPIGTYSSPQTGQPLPPPGIEQYTGGLFAAIPDFHVDVVSATPIGPNTIAEQWVVKGTWTQPFQGGPLAGAKPSGKSFTLPGAGFLQFKDGKIASDTAYFDQMGLLTQLGVIAAK